jgi:hypothetical protein
VRKKTALACQPVILTGPDGITKRVGMSGSVLLGGRLVGQFLPWTELKHDTGFVIGRSVYRLFDLAHEFSEFRIVH